MIKAVLFDMDGVIVDNHAYHVKSWQQFCRRYNKELDERAFDRHINGRTIEAALEELFPGELTEEKRNAYAEEKEELFRTLYKPDLKPVPGLLDFLKELQALGMKTAVATSAMRKNLDFILDGLDIRSYFDVLVDGREVGKSKPEPDIYLHAAEKLGVAPEQCLVLEDSKSGIQAGWNAGMKVIALSTTHSQQELEAFGVKDIVKDFVGLRAEEF